MIMQSDLLIEERPYFLQLRLLTRRDLIGVGHVEQINFEIQRQWKIRPHLAYLAAWFQRDRLRVLNLVSL